MFLVMLLILHFTIPTPSLGIQNIAMCGIISKRKQTQSTSYYTMRVNLISLVCFKKFLVSLENELNNMLTTFYLSALLSDWNGSKRGHVYKFLRSQGFVSTYDTAHQYTDADAHKVRIFSH